LEEFSVSLQKSFGQKTNFAEPLALQDNIDMDIAFNIGFGTMVKN